MSQNRSSAVMAGRVEPPDSLDFFPTPPWATRALIAHALPALAAPGEIAAATAWDPACGAGHMARPLAEAFGFVHASDVHDYSPVWPGQHAVKDFLIEWDRPRGLAAHPPEWIVANPPFRLGAQFIERALDEALVGVAMLVRTAFLEGAARWRAIYAPRPPALLAQFVERVAMVKGRYDPDASTATSYYWLVWKRGAPRLPPFWIPPCRAGLERAGDAAFDPDAGRLR